MQTLRGVENFPISQFKLYHYPRFIEGLAYTKWGYAIANYKRATDTEQYRRSWARVKRFLMASITTFPVDMIQGGAGTSTNMNANEVIANRG